MAFKFWMEVLYVKTTWIFKQARNRIPAMPALSNTPEHPVDNLDGSAGFGVGEKVRMAMRAANGKLMRCGETQAATTK